MSNTVACVTLDAMCAVCGAHYATWVGEDEHGNREYTVGCLNEDGQRYVVHSNDLLEAVCELAVLLEVDLGAMGLFVGNVTGSDAGWVQAGEGVSRGLS